MALVVEDGTGKENANAFAKHSFVIGYWADRGRAVVKRGSDDATKPFQENDTVMVGTVAYTVAQIDAAIVRATWYLSESFSWKGFRRYGRNTTVGTVERFQALAWPRYDVLDREGRYVSEDEVPREIQWATAEAALYELENPAALQPVHQDNRPIQTVKAGSVSVTYDTSKNSASQARPRLLAITDLIGEFLKAGGGNSLVGTVVRA